VSIPHSAGCLRSAQCAWQRASAQSLGGHSAICARGGCRPKTLWRTVQRLTLHSSKPAATAHRRRQVSVLLVGCCAQRLTRQLGGRDLASGAHLEGCATPHGHLVKAGHSGCDSIGPAAPVPGPDPCCHAMLTCKPTTSDELSSSRGWALSDAAAPVVEPRSPRQAPSTEQRPSEQTRSPTHTASTTSVLLRRTGPCSAHAAKGLGGGDSNGASASLVRWLLLASKSLTHAWQRA
jgi:hypothetical protein